MLLRKSCRILAATLLTTTILAGCADNASAPTEGARTEAVQSESTRLAAFFEAKFQEGLARSPEFQTYLGMKSNNDRWDDYSQDELEASFSRAKQDLEELQSGFDMDKLDETSRLSYRLFELRQQRKLAGFEFRHHDYPVNQMYGAHTGFPTMLINNHRIDDIQDAEAYISRLVAVGPTIDDIVFDLELRADKGVLLPKFAFPIVIETLDRLVSGAPFEADALEDNALLADFRKKASALDLSDEDKSALVTTARGALVSSFGPAYKRLRASLVEAEKNATTQHGAWKLPDGAAYYNFSLERQTTSGKTAEEIHAFGLAEVERIHAEMRTLLPLMNFDGSLQEFFAFAQTNEDFYFPATEEGRAAYVAGAQAAIDRAFKKIDAYFLTPLKDPLNVKPVEKFRENAAPLAFYSRPSEEGSRAGIYFVNTANMKSLPSFSMEFIAFHEGIPGHHFQGSVTQNLTDLPKFRRFGGYTAHSEGWGLYSEYLAKEMDLYSSHETDFGRLNGELWRAMRLVADTGMHYKKWSRQETIDYMVANSALDIGTVTNEVERYIVSPGQASSYKMGMKKILDLRARSESKLGERFDIRRFHHEVLRHGGVPLDLLEENIDTWIASEASGTK